MSPRVHIFSEHLVLPFATIRALYNYRVNWCCLLSIKKDLFLEQPEQGGVLINIFVFFSSAMKLR